jgi:hypothetical protein
LGRLLRTETAGEKQRLHDGVVRDDDFVGDKACVALGELALHPRIGVPGNTFDGLRTSEVHGRPRESVYRVRMLAAELPYPGLAKGGGNHRGSIFRLLVGSTLMKRPEFACATWGVNNTAPRAVREAEQAIEQEVSAIDEGNAWRLLAGSPRRGHHQRCWTTDQPLGRCR